MAKKPRVLIFSLAYFPLVGGAEIAVKEITDRLGDSFDFDLITLRFDKSRLSRETMGRVRIFRIDGSKISFPIKSAFLAGKLHRKNQYKISWSIMAAYAGLGVLFFKLLYPRVPMLLTLQEGDSEKHILKKIGIFYPFWKMIFKKADYIQAISNHLVDFAKRHGARCPIEVVPNGVNLDAYKSNKTYKSNGAYTVITTSRLVYKNGVDILIRACAKLQITNYKLQIIGDGPDRSKLEKLVTDLGVADRVKFIGHVDPDLIPQYLSQADIFVRPSRSEGLGNSFLEAMAAGLPVIGTPVGGITDFLKDGETGLFCEIENHNDLAEKIKLLLSDVGLSEKLSKNGRELVISNYSWNSISKRMGELLKSQIFDIRLLLATGIYPPDIGGPATYASLLVKELPRRGVGVKVVTYGPSGVSRGLPKGIRHLVYFWVCFKKALISDVILAQDTISAGLPALVATRLARKKFIIRVPGDYVWEQSVQRFGVNDSIDDFQKNKYGFRVEFLRKVQKFVVGHADTVITPSQYFRKLVSGWVKNPDKVITIYNGVKTSNLKSQTSNHRENKIIVSVGRLVPWKGFDMVISMMLDLPEWKLIIIGDGPEHENLKSQISSHKLENRVELTGAVPREKVLEYLEQTSIFVLNTSFESFSFQIVEAMGLGLPVVTTNIGNISEIITNGFDGILLAPNNKEEFVDAIKKINENNFLREKLSQNALVRSRDFSIERTISNLLEILNK
ncbi:MAG: glycosyltransferase family 4 protein [Patescibacteria group bacterium]